MSLANVIAHARRGDGMYRFVRPAWRAVQSFRVPVLKPIAAILWAERELRYYLVPLFLKIIYREPMFRYRCARVGARPQFEGALPLIYGNGRIEVGDDVSIDGRNTWSVGFKVSTDPVLKIGNRVTIGYQTVISVADRVEIGDDTLMAPNVQIYDNPSHPVSPARRLRHESFEIESVKPVIIGRNVWIGTCAIILRGVTIGDNSIVAAGAVVTKPVPPNVIVAGNPARIVKEITDE